MKVIRVALASPSDVRKERDKVAKVISEINPLLDRELDLAMVLSRWENLPPGFNDRGPQAIIDQALASENADLFIAIFASRLGRALPDGRTGTQHEFEDAYSSWSVKGKPEIMLYFKRARAVSQPGVIAGHVGSVKKFRDDIAKLHKALWREYKNVPDFERMIRLALIEYALKNSPGSRACVPRPPNICWFLKFVPQKLSLADAAVRDKAMKDLQDLSGDSFLRLRDFVPESHSLVVEGKPEGYSAFRRKFRGGSIQAVGSLRIQDVWKLNLSAIDLVQPLYRADSHLLQVLVRKFTLSRPRSRRGLGVHIRLEFERDSPAIWRREARAMVREDIPEKKKQEYQRRIDAVIEGRRKILEFADSDFPFRHANGGVLPIIQVKGRQYYCLFYRETDPIGWNIANGGSDDSDELLDPSRTILRELREELIMVVPPEERYTFKDDTGGYYDRPEYLKALTLWKDIVGWPALRNRNGVRVASIKWERAPDVMTILAGDYGKGDCNDVYVNVTAEDCAIEVDKIAILTAPPNFRLLDGELYGDKLVNRPIGLFETTKFNGVADLGPPTGRKEFKPDIVFYSGDRTDKPSKELFRELIERHMFRQRMVGLVTDEQVALWRAEQNKRSALKLCPITRSIIRRHMQKKSARKAPPVSRLRP